MTRLVLPFTVWEVVERYPYMLRVHDVADALTGLPLPVDATVSFRVTGDVLGTMDGDYRLEIADGRSDCERLSAGDAKVAGKLPALSPQGLALLYAGSQSCANLRLAGHLTGSTAHDTTMNALLGSGQVHVRDFF